MLPTSATETNEQRAKRGLDPIVRDARARIRFEVRPPVRDMIGKPSPRPAGYVLPTTHDPVDPDRKRHFYEPGVHEAVVYVRDLPRIMACVEDRWDAFEDAMRRYFEELREFVDPKGKLRDKLPDDLSEWPTEVRQLEERYPGSPEANFSQDRLRGRRTGLRPLKSCEVVEELDPLLDAYSQQLVQVAQVLASAVNARPADASAIQARDEEITSLRARLEALEHKLSAESNDEGGGRRRRGRGSNSD